LRHRAAIGLALVISAGNVALPIAVQSRLVGSAEQLAESEAVALEHE